VPIRIDMEGVSTSGFEPIESGDYPATVAKTTYAAKSRSSGKPKIDFEFKLVTEDPKLAKRRFWRSYSLMPDALWALKGTLVALGVEVPDGELEYEQSDMSFNGTPVVDLPCTLRIGQQDKWNASPDPETGNIPQENNVEEVLPPQEGSEFGWGH
jgi:hypothetical protein